MFFMMHGTTLCCYSKDTLRVVSKEAYNFYYHSEEQIYFMSQKKI